MLPGETITYLRSTAERLERCSHIQIQDFRSNISIQRMPGLSHQQCGSSPVKIEISMPQTEQRIRCSRTPEVHFNLRRSPGLAQHRPSHIHTDTAVKRIQISVSLIIQVIAIRIGQLIQRIHIEQPVYGFRVCTCIVKQVCTHLPIELVTDPLLLCHRTG